MSRVYRAPAEVAEETVAVSRWSGPRRQRPTAPSFTPPASVEEAEAIAAPMRVQMAACEAVIAEPGPRLGETEHDWGIRRARARRERDQLAPVYVPLAQWIRTQRRVIHGEVRGSAVHTLALLDLVERLVLDGAELTDDECAAVDRARAYASAVRTMHRLGDPGDDGWLPKPAEARRG